MPGYVPGDMTSIAVGGQQLLLSPRGTHPYLADPLLYGHEYVTNVLQGPPDPLQQRCSGGRAEDGKSANRRPEIQACDSRQGQPLHCRAVVVCGWCLSLNPSAQVILNRFPAVAGFSFVQG